jgi:hypothetical protein
MEVNVEINVNGWTHTIQSVMQSVSLSVFYTINQPAILSAWLYAEAEVSERSTSDESINIVSF